MRGVVKFLLTFIIGIALIWLGFWWYAQSRLQSGFTDWAEQQATRGWKVSYDSIGRGTSLLDAAITINNLSLTSPPAPNGEAAAVTLPNVTLRIAALDPLVFHTDLPKKISVNIGNSIGLVLNSGSIGVTENLDPNKLFSRTANPFRGGDFNASNIDILASGSLLVLHIDKISTHADLDLNAGPARNAIYSKTTVDGIAVSPLLARIASIPFEGKLAHLELFGRFSGPVPANLQDVLDQAGSKTGDIQAQQKLIMPVIHQWASQGGNADTGLNVVVGPSTISAAGSVKFDANLQPDGTADLTADHLDQFTAALTASYPTLQNDVTQAEAELSQYLSNTDKGGQTLMLHVGYGKPGIVINGQKAADMPELDWNALENPLPPATQAPPTLAPAIQAPAIQAPGDGSGAASPE